MTHFFFKIHLQHILIDHTLAQLGNESKIYIRYACNNYSQTAFLIKHINIDFDDEILNIPNTQTLK